MAPSAVSGVGAGRFAGLLLLLMLAATPVRAQEAGDWVAQAGWFFVSPQESSTPLRTSLAPSLLGSVLGIDPEFTSPGTSASVSDSGTPALTLSYFFTDHLALKVEGGIPAEFELSGSGVVRPTGISGALISVDLGDPANNPLATARQWSPAALLQYYFFDSSFALRPYLGLGFTYTWFTDVELNSGFDETLNNSFGRTLALAGGKPGPTRVEADASSSFAPIFNAGLAYSLSERWGLSLSVSYILLKTTSTIDLYADDGTRLARSETDLDLNPIVSSLLLSYRF